VGQTVKLKIDAFPKKMFEGKIISIANVGQEIPGEFQNGFKVNVELKDIKENLLPGMTTTNTIITNSIEEAVYVDKTAIRGNDSLRFVLKKVGISVVRQEVKLGEENEEVYRILAGLKKGDKVLLNAMENINKKKLVRL
jgi:multidrug efflux pump subunit AcrA (membrane-fusion protein)